MYYTEFSDCSPDKQNIVPNYRSVLKLYMYIFCHQSIGLTCLYNFVLFLAFLLFLRNSHVDIIQNVMLGAKGSRSLTLIVDCVKSTEITSALNQNHHQ
jgi:hypothetical protein